MSLSEKGYENVRFSAMRPIKLLLADEHALFRHGCRLLLEFEPDLWVVGEGATGREAISAVHRLRPDLALLSTELPDMDGLNAADIIVRTLSTPVITITTCARAEEVLRAVHLGVSAYLLKEDSGDTLIKNIRRVAKGESLLTPQRVQCLLQNFKDRPSAPPTLDTHEALTRREVEVLEQVARGASNRDIALRLDLKAATVNNYVSRLLEKLHLTNRTEAALYALRTGIASLDGDMFV